MAGHKQFDVQPYPEQVLEISRRIKSGQRSLFEFTKALRRLAEQKDITVVAPPKEVRVNLISRFDNLKPHDSPKIARLGSVAMGELIGIRTTSTCDEYATLALGPAVLKDKGDDWQVVELPIADSDYSFDKERTALTDRIDAVLGEADSLWYPESPALQVVEFKADADTAQAFLAYVALLAPSQTEVFEASIRFRPPVLGAPLAG
jgi:hypothetical protein